MSPRALAAAAALTAALAGPAFGQFPPDAAPLGPVGGPAAPGGHPYFGPMPPPGAYPPGPVPGPLTGGPVIDPGYTPMGGGCPPGAGLPTDGLAGLGTARGPRCWVGLEYLLYWTKDAPVSVPLATAGPAGGTGVLGTPGTRVVLGGTPFDFGNFNGVRVVAGTWLSDTEQFGLEGNFFILPEKSSGTPPVVGVPGLPTLARPFFDITQNRQNARILARPNTLVGGIQAEATQELWGAEALSVWRAFDRGGRWTADVLSGFKFLSLEEGLTVSDFSAARPGGVVNFLGRGFGPGAVTFVTDRFTAENRFYGATLGTRTNLHYNAVTVSMTGKVAVGTMLQEVRADGTSTITGGFPVPVTAGGGFFSAGGNTGRFDREEFAFIPEFSTNLAVQVTSRLTVTFGYNYLYVSDVVRPGDQLDTRINPTLLPTSQNFGVRFRTTEQPTVPFRTSDYWAHGFNLGLTLGW